MSVRACIALGSNLGDRASHVEFGFGALAALPESRLLARSSVIETQAVLPPGGGPQGPYLNAAGVVETGLLPQALLGELLAAERARGRVRTRGLWEARTLDLDLLLFGGLILDEPGLTIPHPRMHERLFVLRPLAEVAPDAVVPTLGRTVADLLAELLR